MTTHKGVRVRLLSPAGPLLDVGSYHLYLSAKLRQAGIIPTGPAAIEGEWVTLFPINLADGSAIELQVMPTEEVEVGEEEQEEEEQCPAGTGGPFRCELPWNHEGSHASTFKWDP